MRNNRRFVGTLAQATTASALLLGSIAIAAAPANATSASGLANGYVGVTQSIAVTDFCPSGNVQLQATVNGSVISSPSASSDGNGNATILWVPASVGSVTNAQVQSSLVGSACGKPTDSGS